MKFPKLVVLLHSKTLGSASTWRLIENDVSVKSAKDNVFGLVCRLAVIGKKHQDRQELVKALCGNVVIVSPLVDDSNVVENGEHEH